MPSCSLNRSLELLNLAQAGRARQRDGGADNAGRGKISQTPLSVTRQRLDARRGQILIRSRFAIVLHGSPSFARFRRPFLQ